MDQENPETVNSAGDPPADDQPAEDFSEPERCANCHQPLTERSADGVCLRCLLAFALMPDDATAGSSAAADGEAYCELAKAHDQIQFYRTGMTPEGRAVDHRGTYRALRRYEDYDRVLAKGIALSPIQEPNAFSVERSYGRIEGWADVRPLRTIEEDPAATTNLGVEGKTVDDLVLALYQHDANALSRVLAVGVQDQFSIVGVVYPKAWFATLAAKMRGDSAGAQAAFAAARPEVEKPSMPMCLMAAPEPAGNDRRRAGTYGRCRPGGSPCLRINDAIREILVGSTRGAQQSGRRLRLDGPA